jgi:hypothetical protein
MDELLFGSNRFCMILYNAATVASISFVAMESPNEKLELKNGRKRVVIFWKMHDSVQIVCFSDFPFEEKVVRVSST